MFVFRVLAQLMKLFDFFFTFDLEYLLWKHYRPRLVVKHCFLVLWLVCGDEDGDWNSEDPINVDLAHVIVHLVAHLIVEQPHHGCIFKLRPEYTINSSFIMILNIRIQDELRDS